RRTRKHPSALEPARKGPKEGAHHRVHRDASYAPGLRPWDGEDVRVEIYLLPLEPEQFEPTQTSVQGHPHRAPQLTAPLHPHASLLVVREIPNASVILLEKLHLPHRVTLHQLVVYGDVEETLEERDLPVNGRRPDLCEPLRDIPLDIAHHPLAQGTVTKD